jgi:hypothetical protein
MLDRPVVLSPKDWALISDWHQREIPLTLILESMRHAAEHPRRRSAPRNLAYIAPAIEEAWRVVLDGRRGAPEAPARPSTFDPGDAWRRRLEIETGDSLLGQLLSELLTAYEAGEPTETLDARLNERLITSVTEALLRSATDEVNAELAPFMERMDAATLDRTCRSGIVDRLRRALDLPVLGRRRTGA